MVAVVGTDAVVGPAAGAVEEVGLVAETEGDVALPPETDDVEPEPGTAAPKAGLAAADLVLAEPEEVVVESFSPDAFAVVDIVDGALLDDTEAPDLLPGVGSAAFTPLPVPSNTESTTKFVNFPNISTPNNPLSFSLFSTGDSLRRISISLP